MSIKQEWARLKVEAVYKWRDEIEKDLLPAASSRNIELTFVTAVSGSGEGNSSIVQWEYVRDTIILQITADTRYGFKVFLKKNSKETFWPTNITNTKNDTVDDLMRWFDGYSW